MGFVWIIDSIALSIELSETSAIVDTSENMEGKWHGGQYVDLDRLLH